MGIEFPILAKPVLPEVLFSILRSLVKIDLGNRVHEIRALAATLMQGSRQVANKSRQLRQASKENIQVAVELNAVAKRMLDLAVAERGRMMQR